MQVKFHMIVSALGGALAAIFIVSIGIGVQPTKDFQWETLVAGILGLAGGSFAFAAVNRQIVQQSKANEIVRIEKLHTNVADMLFSFTSWLMLSEQVLNLFEKSPNEISLKIVRSVMGLKLKNFDRQFRQKLARANDLPANLALLVLVTYEMVEVFVHIVENDDELDAVMRPVVELQIEAIKECMQILVDFKNFSNVSDLEEIEAKHDDACEVLLNQLLQQATIVGAGIERELV